MDATGSMLYVGHGLKICVYETGEGLRVKIIDEQPDQFSINHNYPDQINYLRNRKSLGEGKDELLSSLEKAKQKIATLERNLNFLMESKLSLENDYKTLGQEKFVLQSENNNLKSRQSPSADNKLFSALEKAEKKIVILEKNLRFLTKSKEDLENECEGLRQEKFILKKENDNLKSGQLPPADNEKLLCALEKAEQKIFFLEKKLDSLAESKLSLSKDYKVLYQEKLRLENENVALRQGL